VVDVLRNNTKPVVWGPCSCRDDDSSLSFVRSSLFTMMPSDRRRRSADRCYDVINRRQILGLLPAREPCAVAGLCPCRYQRSEIREDWPQAICRWGTVRHLHSAKKIGRLFVIASDKERRRARRVAGLGPSRITNAVIAMEEPASSADPDKDVFKWRTAFTRSIEAWNSDHTLRSAIARGWLQV